MDPWTRKVLIVLWLLVIIGGICLFIELTYYNPHHR